MNKQTVLRVFISSPTDVNGEREAVNAAIEELNTTWSANLGLRLEPITWEQNCRPAVGKDSQEVINQQLSDYQIFVGVMWKRFGTPTSRFGSGTEEEFERAFQRNRKNSKSISLLTYFKDEPVPPSEIDIDQLERVNAFKKKLRSKGVLYRTYQSSDEFQKLVRIHLSLELQQWLKRIPVERRTKRKVPQKKNARPINRTTDQNPRLLTHHEYVEECRKRVVALMAEHYAALDEYLSRLDSVGKVDDVEQLVLATIIADKSLCDRLEPILGALAESIYDMIEAWIGEFSYELLGGTTKKGSARNLLSRLRSASKTLEDQARRADFQIPVEKVLLGIPRFAVTHKRMVNLFKSISAELKTGARLLTEAADAVEQSMRGKKSR